MGIFAGSLMFMAVGEKFSDVAVGNSVFIIGGKGLQFASNILLSIFNEIERKEEELSFKVYGVSKKSASGVGTIADYFNTKQGKRGGSVREAVGSLYL
jgi:hypothetical protein